MSVSGQCYSRNAVYALNLVLDGIIRLLASAWTRTWIIRYIYENNVQFLSHLWKVMLFSHHHKYHQPMMAILFRTFGLLPPKDLLGFSNMLIMSVPNECICMYRDMHTLFNQISTFPLQEYKQRQHITFPDISIPSKFSAYRPNRQTSTYSITN